MSIPAFFFGTDPVIQRSIFVDKGPIAKPPIVLQAGSGATLPGPNEVSLPGAALTQAHVGLYISLAGSSNAGSYRIAAVLSSSRARLAASFALPDAGGLTWQLVNPRQGEIASAPEDVTVRVNGVPVLAQAVQGLLGQVVLPFKPTSTDEVKIDYQRILAPTVEMRALNDPAFTLNASRGRTARRGDPRRNRTYRYNVVLPNPSTLAAALLADPEDPSVLARQGQPLLRQVHYRGYERAYTATLNAPDLLRLNTPTGKVAYPTLRRQVVGSFVQYEALSLPEADGVSPWTRRGTAGTATVGLGQLVVTDTAGGTYPVAQPIFWTRPLDLTFEHAYALAWRMQLDAVPALEGVWTGVAVGWSNGIRALVLGYLADDATTKVGFLKAGGGNIPSLSAAWTGGRTNGGVATGTPAVFDWTALHNYRIFRAPSGVIQLFIDGSVEPLLSVSEAELPFLDELTGPFTPFTAIENVFFGSLSRPARSISTWDFIRYEVLPTSPVQSAPSSFVSYEANTLPSSASPPWTPVGYHGVETLLDGDTLLLDSTAASTLAASDPLGLIGGNYRGLCRIEPLLAVSSDVVLDVRAAGLASTHGFSPSALMAAIDDGQRLVQLSLLSGAASGKYSYPGDTLPTAATPYAFSQVGGTVDPSHVSAAMLGRSLRITDASTTDGLIYSIEDQLPEADPLRVLSYAEDWRASARLLVQTYVVDGSGFAGVTMDVYDGILSNFGRVVGLLLQEVGGVRQVALHSDGVVLGGAAWAFDWFDGKEHTYTLVKSTDGNLVSLLIDAVYVGSATYGAFTSISGAQATFSFGSATAASSVAQSVVVWVYANVWRVPSAPPSRYVGLWKGVDGDSLLGYHLPLLAQGKGASVAGNVLTDASAGGGAGFPAAGVVVGSQVIVDVGSNRGVYAVTGLGGGTTLTLATPFPAPNSLVGYRIPSEHDWAILTRYRIVRDPAGQVALFLDDASVPAVSVSYSQLDLPPSSAGFVRRLSGGLPAVVFGAFDPTNLSQSSWAYVRYGVTAPTGYLRAVPHHQVLSRRNVMASPEHLTSDTPHAHTDFASSSTGIPPKAGGSADFYSSGPAATQLSELVPLVPQTQSIEVRRPSPQAVSVSGLNRPEDVLNTQDGSFTLNDSTTKLRLVVPKDVLYASLDVIEQTTGEVGLISPVSDEGGLRLHQGGLPHLRRRHPARERHLGLDTLDHRVG